MGDVFRIEKVAILLVLSVIFGGCGGGGDSVSSISTTPSTPSTSLTVAPDPFDVLEVEDSEKLAFINAINSKRTATGGQDCGEYGHFDPAPPLIWSDELYGAAYEHSYDMAKSDMFSHDGSGTENDWTAQVQNLGRGSTVQERLENNNYNNYSTMGENIAAGTNMDTVQEVIDGWMGSPEHCKNIMNPIFKDVGLAMVYEPTSTYNYYWTQEFGTRF
jgi:uncharacterized protein YkwD